MEWIPMERRKRGRPRKMWIEGVQAAMTTRNLETERNGVWFLEDGDSCYKTGQIDQIDRQIYIPKQNIIDDTKADPSYTKEMCHPNHF